MALFNFLKSSEKYKLLIVEKKSCPALKFFSMLNSI